MIWDLDIPMRIFLCHTKFQVFELPSLAFGLAWIAGIPVHVPTTCKDFDTTSFKFGKLEYDKDPVGNVTDDNDVYDYSYNGAVSGEVKVVNAYPNGTLARVVCKEGYGTYLDDDGLATNRVEKEVNTTCIDGGWTVDLDIYTRSPPETTYDFLVCEPHNADWKSSSKEDYFGVDHGAYGGSRDEGAEDDEGRYECVWTRTEYHRCRNSELALYTS